MIRVDNDTADEDAVNFRPFVGVAPRGFIGMFEAQKRKDDKGRAIVWDAANAAPKILQRPNYDESELPILAFLKSVTDQAKPQALIHNGDT